MSINGNLAIVKIGGLLSQACLDLVDDIHEGDEVLIHTGFVIQKISSEEAEETRRLMREIENASETL